MQVKVLPESEQMKKRNDALARGQEVVVAANETGRVGALTKPTCSGRQSARLATKSRKRSELSSVHDHATDGETAPEKQGGQESNVAAFTGRRKGSPGPNGKAARGGVQGAVGKRKRQESGESSASDSRTGASTIIKSGKFDKEHDKYCHFCQHVKVNMLACESPGCTHRFCNYCLQVHLGDRTDPTSSPAWKQGLWSCPTCRGECCCSQADCSRAHRHCKAFRYRCRRANAASLRMTAAHALVSLAVGPGAVVKPPMPSDGSTESTVKTEDNHCTPRAHASDAMETQSTTDTGANNSEGSLGGRPPHEGQNSAEEASEASQQPQQPLGPLSKADNTENISSVLFLLKAASKSSDASEVGSSKESATASNEPAGKTRSAEAIAEATILGTTSCEKQSQTFMENCEQIQRVDGQKTPPSTSTPAAASPLEELAMMALESLAACGSSGTASDKESSQEGLRSETSVSASAMNVDEGQARLSDVMASMSASPQQAALSMRSPLCSIAA